VKKPGRPRSLDPRQVQVSIRLTAAELAYLDRVRGTAGRSEFIRALLRGTDPKIG